MADAVRVGVAGLTHGHVWGIIENFAKVPGVQLVAVADSTPLLERAKERFNSSYQDWRQMLDGEQLDVLVVTSNNVESAEIAVQALGRGIPCFVEKAMAANAADADRMLAAARGSGATLMINWPLAWAPWIFELKRQIDSGSIGHVFNFRYRNGHHGPKEIGCDQWFVGWLYSEELNGGGAIADFCSYGAVLCRWLFGMPESVYARRDNYTKDYPVPDDYAVCMLNYPKKQALIEGTWAHFGNDLSANPVAYGKSGTLAVQGENIIHTAVGNENLAIVPEALPETNSAAYFLKCVRDGTQPEGILNPEIAADACRILDAAKKSCVSGCSETP